MITQEQLKKLFKYEDGNLIRLTKSARRVSIGDIAGSLHKSGYIRAKVNSKIYTAHRLVFLYHHGYLPKFIDHINGIRNDNRIENLRSCSNAENLRNSKAISGRLSKYKGVTWHKRSRLWQSSISFNGKCYYLGKFWDEEVAAQVTRIARIKYHGVFANNG